MNETDMWTSLLAQLRAYIGRRVGDPHAVDDILQDTLLKITTRQEALGNVRELDRWANGVARHAIADHYRKRGGQPYGDLNHVSDEARSDVNSNAMVASWLPQFLQGLPAKYREAVELSDMQGQSQKAAALLLGLSYSAFKSRVQRGRAMIKQRLQACCQIDLDRRGNVVEVQRQADCRCQGLDECDAPTPGR